MSLHGNGAWAIILRTGSFAAHRTNVDLKDKWRNMVRDARGIDVTEGADNQAGLATQDADGSSGGDGGSERSTAKPSGRAPAGCASDLTSGTWGRACDKAIERGGRGAKRRRGQAPCHKE